MHYTGETESKYPFLFLEYLLLRENSDRDLPIGSSPTSALCLLFMMSRIALVVPEDSLIKAEIDLFDPT